MFVSPDVKHHSRVCMIMRYRARRLVSPVAVSVSCMQGRKQPCLSRTSHSCCTRAAPMPAGKHALTGMLVRSYHNGLSHTTGRFVRRIPTFFPSARSEHFSKVLPGTPVGGRISWEDTGGTTRRNWHVPAGLAVPEGRRGRYPSGIGGTSGNAARED